MECSCDNFVLLFLCKLYKVNRIARNTDSKLRIKLRVLLGVKEKFSVKHVYVEVVTAFVRISVEQSHKVVLTLFLGFAESRGYDCKRI